MEVRGAEPPQPGYRVKAQVEASSNALTGSASIIRSRTIILNTSL